jgi:hypothetical protein
VRTVFLKVLISPARSAGEINTFRKTVQSLVNVSSDNISQILACCFIALQEHPKPAAETLLLCPI